MYLPTYVRQPIQDVVRRKKVKPKSLNAYALNRFFANVYHGFWNNKSYHDAIGDFLHSITSDDVCQLYECSAANEIILTPNDGSEIATTANVYPTHPALYYSDYMQSPKYIP